MGGRRWTVLGLLLALLSFPTAPALAQDPYSATASARGGALPVHQESAALAARSAQAQARTGKLFHADLSPVIGPCRAAGETVGRGPSLEAIFQAFRASPDHWRIITSSRWTSMGAGQATGADGRLYVSLVFCEAAGGAPAAQPPAARSAAPAPSGTGPSAVLPAEQPDRRTWVRGLISLSRGGAVAALAIRAGMTVL